MMNEQTASRNPVRVCVCVGGVCMCIHFCVCVGQRVMTTTAGVITEGFITATDRAASKTLTVCVCVCMS